MGSRERTEQFATPLYRRPDDLLVVELSALYPELKGKRVRGRVEGNKVVPYFSRGETREAPALVGHEIVWIDNALDAFMLEVQGSGRVAANYRARPSACSTRTRTGTLTGRSGNISPTRAS